MPTNVKWVLEGYLWEDGSIERFEASIRKLGLECVTLSPEEARNGMKSLGEVEECVVFYGSLETAKQVVREKPWIPGVFYTPVNYQCHRYYPAFGSYLLNADCYGLYPYGELIRLKDTLFSLFGQDNAIFIRPDAGEKTFTGRMILRENFEKDVEYCGFYGVDPHALVVVSTPKNIVAEWRFFVSEGKVITGSLYRLGSNPVALPAVDLGSWELAEKTAGLYNPDGVWALDICKTQTGNLYVLEIGCMSCAGVYGCDTDRLAEVATQMAVKEYQSCQ